MNEKIEMVLPNGMVLISEPYGDTDMSLVSALVRSSNLSNSSPK